MRVRKWTARTKVLSSFWMAGIIVTGGLTGQALGSNYAWRRRVGYCVLRFPLKPGAGSSPLPRRGEGIFTSARPPRASPAVEGGFETRPYVASPSLRERDV